MPARWHSCPAYWVLPKNYLGIIRRIMKLAFYDDFKLGVVKDDTVVDVSEAVSGI